MMAFVSKETKESKALVNRSELPFTNAFIYYINIINKEFGHIYAVNLPNWAIWSLLTKCAQFIEDRRLITATD